MTRMNNPPHPGEMIREYLGDITITAAAKHLSVSRTTLQRAVSCTAGISPDMAYRLGVAFGTSPDLWAGLQMQYDLHIASQVKRPQIGRLAPKFGNAVEDNPDLSPQFINDTLLAVAEADAGQLTDYKSSSDKN